MGLREELVASNCFIVVLGQTQYSFSKVTNIADSIELETVEEGGFNTSPRLMIKPKGRVETLSLERGVQKSKKASGKEKELKTGTHIYMGLVIVIEGTNVTKAYGFEEGIVTKWETGELDAVGKGLLIEKLEITHTGLEEVSGVTI